MTIFDSGYSSFQYEPVGSFGRLWPLASSEFGKIFRTRKGLVLFIACVVYVVVLLVLVFLAFGPVSSQMQGIGRASPRFWPFTREFYASYSTAEGFMAFLLLSSIVSIRSIAADKATNALEIYWTRGITPWGYFLAKWFGSFLLLAAVFVAGPVVVWLYALISSPDLTFLEETIRFIPSVVLALVVKSAVLSFLAVGFSAFGSSPNVITFLWLMLMLGSTAVVKMLKAFASMARHRNPEEVQPPTDWYDALSPWEAMSRIEQKIAGIAAVGEYPVWIAIASLGFVGVLILWRLHGQLRTTEAMA